MRRSNIQQIIIPRNWLFGRLSYMYANLNNILRYSYTHFTKYELEELDKAQDIIKQIINTKKKQSEIIKKSIISNEIK